MLNSARTASRPSLFLTLPNPRSRLGMDKRLGGDKPRQLTPTDQRDIPYHMTLCSAIKALAPLGGRAFVIKAFSFWSNSYTNWGPTSQAVAGHRLLSRGSFVCFLCFHAWPLLFFIKLSSFWPMSSSSYFLYPVPLRRGVMEWLVGHLGPAKVNPLHFGTSFK